MTLTFHLIPPRMAKMHKTATTNAGKDMGEGDPSFTVGIVNWCCPSENLCVEFSKSYGRLYDLLVIYPKASSSYSPMSITPLCTIAKK